MKKVIINDGQIIKKQTSNKVRLVSIINNQVLVADYANLFMLPGGKIDEGETSIEALKREIKEELGYSLDETRLIPLIKTDVYQNNYLSRDNETIEKNNETEYYITDEDIFVDTSSQNLSDREKSCNITFSRIDIYDLIKLLESKNNSPKEIAFSKELIVVLKEYLNKYKLIDLHTHTNNSDGEHSPEEVMELAIKNNVSILAITDHDNIEGLASIPYDKYPELKVIPGVEITAKVDHGRMHVLGYDIDYRSKYLNEFLRQMKINNLENLKRIVNYLKTIGITFSQEELESIYCKKTNVGRPDIARLMIKHGLVETVDQAFEEYLVEAFNMVRHMNVGFTYRDVLKAIEEANGISILAHPNSLELEESEFEELLQNMIKHGLKGIEVFHPDLNREEREFYYDMVKKYNLLYSAGSDFHGENVKPDTQIGYGKNNLYIHDASILRRIK